MQVHDEVRTAGEDAASGLASVDIGVVGHSKHLLLQCVPRAAALHGVVGEIGDGVDRFVADDRRGFMEERVEKYALEGGDGVRGELVVERETVRRGWAEEETVEEDEREGAHLGAQSDAYGQGNA